MAENNEIVDTQEGTQEGQIQDQNQQEETVQLSEDEQRAYDHGWRPKEEWDGEPEDWVSAREFNKRASLFARIAKYGAENREMKESLRKLFDHNRKLYDAGYKKAMEDLKTQRADAIEEGDTRRLVQVEDQIDNLKSEHENAIREFDTSVVDTKQTGPTAEQQVIFENWLDANPWYQKNASLTQVADTLARSIVEKATANGNRVEYGKLLNQVAREVRENNPEFFTNKQTKTSPVDGGSRGTKRPGNSGGRYSLNSIPAEERVIAQTIMQSTGLTEEQYVKQYMEAKRG